MGRTDSIGVGSTGLTEKNTVGVCAEFRAANQLLLTEVIWRQFNRQDFEHPHFDKATQQYYKPHEHSYGYNENGFCNGVWQRGISTSKRICKKKKYIWFNDEIPFDKFSNEVLFADESRSFYKKCCRDNMEILFDCLKNLMDLLYISQAAIFVVEGYDDYVYNKVQRIQQK